MEEFVGKQISVIGAARSGIASSRVLTALGASVLLSDSKPLDALDASVRDEILSLPVQFVSGASVEAALSGAELVITSPGVPKFAPVLQEAVRRNIPVWSEIELAYRITDAPIVATTGTNGKTTTTLLIAAMLDAADIPNIVCGNVSADEIKRSMVEAAFAARDMNPRPVLVAEISSFQLEWVEKFAPKVAVLTNVFGDHLDRYENFADYQHTKFRLFAAQSSEDWAIVSYRRTGSGALINTEGFRERYNEKLVGVWIDLPDYAPESSAWETNGKLFVHVKPGEEVYLMNASEFPPSLPGEHSIENVLAAASAALIVGAMQDVIADAVRNFKGVAHRMEFVAEVGGVRYINNSMCTNVNAALSSLKAVEGRAIVIMGGVDKGLSFKPMVPTLKEKAKHVVLIGKVAQDLEMLFLEGSYYDVSRAATLQEALELAREKAEPGDTILLSPACASFDMFKDFEDRGRQFRAIVNNIVESE